LDRFSRVVGGVIVTLFLLLNLMPIYAAVRETITDVKLIHVSDVYELTKEYHTFKETKVILGVKVSVELDVPKVVINDEYNTFTYRVKVDNAPSEWRLNITEAVIKASFCIERTVQKLATVLRGGESLTKQLTAKALKTSLGGKEELPPGFPGICLQLEFTINYVATFGTNREEDYILLRAHTILRSREIPLELKPNIFAKPAYLPSFGGIRDTPGLEFNGEIRIRNVQNWEIVLSRFVMCILGKLADWGYSPSTCNEARDLASTVIRPGEEYVINVNEQATIHELRLQFKDVDFSRDIVFIIEYITPNGKAQNWVLYKVSGRVIKVTEETASPTKVTTTRTPTETRTTATIGTARAETPGPVVVTTTGPAATGPSTDAFTLALILVPIAVAAATATVFAVRWLRKAPT
jgi:hypothetical protein